MSASASVDASADHAASADHVASTDPDGSVSNREDYGGGAFRCVLTNSDGDKTTIICDGSENTTFEDSDEEALYSAGILMEKFNMDSEGLPQAVRDDLKDNIASSIQTKSIAPNIAVTVSNKIDILFQAFRMLSETHRDLMDKVNEQERQDYLRGNRN